MKIVTIPTKIVNKGHYVPGVISKGRLYVSGQLPVHHESGEPISGGIAEQTRQALHNVDLVLHAAGCRKEDIVMCRVYISNMDNWDEANAVCAEFFGDHRPARVVVPTRELHFGALVEIEAEAELPE